MNRLYYAAGSVDSSAAQSHITYAFQLDQPVDTLRIEFRYDPKKLDDMETSKKLIEEAMRRYGYESQQEKDWEKYAPLQNLLTLSIDDPRIHRGQAHRQDPQQTHYLSAASASPGFWPGVNEAGLWKITISLHAVVTEHCNYELEVWDGGQE
ncbi:hypothetical protein [Paenibacillus wulumuqiensis]|uniref:hypothetical protein n=1 Tax=Paenibacillus wulumuqiensis TaxID=1567107 RepID=UPI00061912B0|nr:hypothetical protein [Paenibacillus wulumuqiensis]